MFLILHFSGLKQYVQEQLQNPEKICLNKIKYTEKGEEDDSKRKKEIRTCLYSVL